jgi:enamine deaminase RidA (YjgF/YER057c/UK114 family)
MRCVIYPWLGREFVKLTAEARAEAPADEALRQLLDQFGSALEAWGLGLQHTVRTRLWARDRESRDLASGVRLQLLSGEARSASSSYYAPSHFDSAASVGLDLWAMRPSQPSARKTICEYEPPIVPVRFIAYDSVVFLSGVTHELGSLDEQLGNILTRIGESLREAGCGWDSVARVSCFLQRGQSIDTLRVLMMRHVPLELDRAEYSLVDGYSRPGKLIEIEVTARPDA